MPWRAARNAAPSSFSAIATMRSRGISRRSVSTPFAKITASKDFRGQGIGEDVPAPRERHSGPAPPRRVDHRRRNVDTVIVDAVGATGRRQVIEQQAGTAAEIEQARPAATRRNRGEYLQLHIEALLEIAAIGPVDTERSGSRAGKAAFVVALCSGSQSKVMRSD